MKVGSAVVYIGASHSTALCSVPVAPGQLIAPLGGITK
ncbi:uncharacterized protein METZ01_LOCUS430832 [marine metagenome]|uniref:Uncharacterized protein n=1 Tax=marine metagenome TaxID=408172 RepID=A0A382Y653_9ZZZZ